MSARQSREVTLAVSHHQRSGFPPSMEEKQARLGNDLRRCWEAGLAGILSVLPPEEI